MSQMKETRFVGFNLGKARLSLARTVLHGSALGSGEAKAFPDSASEVNLESWSHCVCASYSSAQESDGCLMCPSPSKVRLRATQRLLSLAARFEME